MIRIREECRKDHEKVVALGGLHVIGTERHEARRIDNQLRGRAGRQGDPGSSQFFLSLEDDLLRLFGGDRMKRMMERFNMPDDEPIEHRTITKLIENAQKKVEQWHFDIRKHLLEYDDVMNRQRELVYGLRRRIMEGGEQVTNFLSVALENVVGRLVAESCPEKYDPQDWDWETLARGLHETFQWDIRPDDLYAQVVEANIMGPEALQDWLIETLQARLQAKAALVGDPSLWNAFLRDVVLYVLDSHWKEHLYALDLLKETIGFRGFGQKDPLVEFKRESFQLFEEMLDRVEETALRYIYWVQVAAPETMTVRRRQPRRYQYRRPELARAPESAAAGATATAVATAPEEAHAGVVHTVRRKHPKIGRNDPCPCGSGKKYKKCCLLKEVRAAS